MNISSAPMKTIITGNIAHGTIVMRKPQRAQTLTLVMVLAMISTTPVKARPKREWTVSILRMAPEKWTKMTR